MTKPLYARLTVGTVFLAVFLAVLLGFYYYAQNPDNLLPGNDQSEIKPVQMYNTGVLKYLAGNTDEAIKLWQERLTHEDTDNTERFYLHANLGITYLKLSNSEKTAVQQQLKYAKQAVNAFKDAYSYLLTIGEQDTFEEPIEINLELAKKRYNQLTFQNKDIPQDTPLKIVQDLLRSELNIYNRLNSIDESVDKTDPNVIGQILSKSKSNKKRIEQIDKLIR